METNTSKNSSLNGFKLAHGITSAPTEKYSYFATADTNFKVGDISIPQYSKGFFSSNGSVDGCLVMVDLYNNLYICFRTNNVWSSRRI